MSAATALACLATALAGIAGGLLVLWTRIPSAPLAGAMLGAGLMSVSQLLPKPDWPPGTRTALEIAIGTVIGSSLSVTAFSELRHLWRPALFITLALLASGLAVGILSSKLLGLNLVTALLGAAPGGLTGMSLVGEELGVGAAVVALHTLRLITVLTLLPVVVRLLMSRHHPPTGGL